MLKKKFFCSALVIIALGSFIVQAQNSNSNWPQWRGPLDTGVALPGNPPIEFGESKNLKWKTPIPGGGHATPIVWGDHIIVVTAVPTEEKVDMPKEEEVVDDQQGRRSRPAGNTTQFIHEFKVISIDKNSGQINWQTTVTRELPLEGTHQLGSWASNSPVTDGKFIYAYFGSRGLYCLDFDGNIKWQRDWGQMEKHGTFGEGSSPALYKDKIVVLWDHNGQSLIEAVYTGTGETIWKKDRDEGTSWSTPLIVEVNGKPQVITNATNNIRSYDLATGDIVWKSTGMTRNVIPIPIYGDGIVYLMSGFRGSALQAIDLAKAEGDISGTETILWEYNEATPYTPCPVLMDGYLYFLRVNNGFLTCLDAKSGEVQYAVEKVEGISAIFSSPTAVGDRIYIAATEAVTVVKAGPKFEVIATNTLDDTFHASPVIIGDELFLRGFKNLYCFAEDK